MVTRSMSKLAATAGGLALAALASAGIASADGLSQQAINTTCNYDQVHSALRAQNPGFADQLDSFPTAQNFLRTYLASGPDARRAQAQDAQVKHPIQAGTFIPVINQVAATCNNY
jgi:hemophore-related protein